MRLDRFLLVCAIQIAFVIYCAAADDDYKWVCDNGKCLKTRHDPKSKEPALCLEACKMFCNEYGLLWPRPTGETDLGNFLSKINLNSIEMKIERHGETDKLLQAAFQRFLSIVANTIPKDATPKTKGKALDVHLINQDPENGDFSLDMHENYTLKISGNNDKVEAYITGGSFFGVRHGLETLSQLILYDAIRDHLLIAGRYLTPELKARAINMRSEAFFSTARGEYNIYRLSLARKWDFPHAQLAVFLLYGQIVRDVNIADNPVYPYRGILLDTARNYHSVDSIKKTIDAMAAVKLNTFHWHITDSQSFPFVSEKRPELSKYGAYSPAKVYSVSAMREIVEYGRVRGVRVLPEFDAPAHVGEGWQETDLTVCFKAEPWASFCVEPPCGQLNPTKDELYDVLEDIYTDMAEVFQPDIFHMGGDEVSERCWNVSEEIQQFMIQHRWDLNKAGFLNLWDYFQKKAQEKAYKAFGKKLPLILWTSTLTDYSYVDKYLNKDDYIIQVWTTGVDPQIQGLLSKGYRLIMSNYDALYLDCGFGAWVGAGNNWCSPYIGWQKVYDNSISLMASENRHLILGGEAALWSEQSDTATLDARLWPRAAALAERLWTEPATTWLDAEHRMLHMRERLVRMGIQAESIQPEWCYQNEGYCYR